MARVYRRGPIYWGVFERNGRRHRRSLKTADRAVAERRLRDWIKELEGIAFGEKPYRSFVETAELFIRHHLPTIRPLSAKRYALSLKVLAQHFGGMTLNKITRAELLAFENWRRSQGLSTGTIRHDLVCLSCMFRTAQDHEWLDDTANPVPAFLRRRAKAGLKESAPRTRYLTQEEEARLLEAATPEVRDAIILAIDTGLRSEELFGLTWSQVDRVRGLITTSTKTKSGRARKVPLPKRAAEVCDRLPRYEGCPYVLVNPDTRKRYWHMIQGLKGAVRRSKIERIRWHDLRRTAACRWLQRDRRTIAEVSMLLGHSSVTVTETRYAFLEAEEVALEIARGTNSATRKVRNDASAA
jgi:integrase